MQNAIRSARNNGQLSVSASNLDGLFEMRLNQLCQTHESQEHQIEQLRSAVQQLGRVSKSYLQQVRPRSNPD